MKTYEEIVEELNKTINDEIHRFQDYMNEESRIKSSYHIKLIRLNVLKVAIDIFIERIIENHNDLKALSDLDYKMIKENIDGLIIIK